MPWRSGSSAWRSSRDLRQRAGEIFAESGEIALDPGRAADDDMIGAVDTFLREDFAGERAEAALHAVSNDGVADLLSHREADALDRVAILAIADEQDEPGRGRALSSVRGEEVSAF
jgi:hypothetical protein